MSVFDDSFEMNRRRHIFSFFTGFLVICTLLGNGCSRLEKSPVPADSAEKPVWPPPPAPARILWTQEVHRPIDLGIKRSALTRFGQWITGSDRGNEALAKPFALALDEADNLCVTDTADNTVSFYNASTKKWTRWEKVGKVRFASPVAVAKRQKTIYVADSALPAVIAFDESGKFLFTITNQLSRPTGVALAGQKLFVVDSSSHAVLCYSLDGNFLSRTGKRGNGPGEFNFPTHLSADSQNRLYVTDSMNSRVQILDAQGHFVAQIGEIGDRPGNLSRPKGVSVDSAGNIYVVDAMFDNVQIFDRSGRILLFFGSQGSGAGQFWLPNGIAISRSDDIYVADCYNHRIQVLKYVGAP